MKYIARRVSSSSDELLVVAASIGNRREQDLYFSEVQDVMSQTSPTDSVRVAMWPAISDPLLQVADYCSWAICRKWERADNRSYELIKDKVKTEFEI